MNNYYERGYNDLRVIFVSFLYKTNRFSHDMAPFSLVCIYYIVVLE